MASDDFPTVPEGTTASHDAAHMAPAATDGLPTIQTPGGEDAEALFALKNLEKRRAARKRKRRLQIAGIIALVALVAGAIVLNSMMGASEEEVPTGPDVTYVVRQDFSTSVQGSGALMPYDSVVVTPEIDGIIATVEVSEGQTVKKGDTLFTIRNADLDKAVSDAAEQVSSAQEAVSDAYAAVSDLESAYARDKATYDSAAADAAAAEERAAAAGKAAYDAVVSSYAAELDSAYRALQDAEAEVTAKVEDLRKVHEDEGTLDQFDQDDPDINIDYLHDSVAMQAAKRELGTAYLTRDLAQNQYDNAQTRFKIADEQGKTAYDQAYASVPIPAVPAFSEASYTSQIDSARSAAHTAESALSSARKLYDTAVEQAEKRTVKAPKGGTLVTLGARVGATVGASATAGSLAQIADVTKMKIAIEVNEIDISEIAVGQRARCTFSAAPGVELMGKVVEVASTASGSSEGMFGGGVVTYTVRVVVEHPDERLKPGMTASVTILTQDVPDALVIPAMALVEDGDATYVCVVTDEETLATELREVKVGARSAAEVVVESGLEEGECILLSGDLGVWDAGAADGAEDAALAGEDGVVVVDDSDGTVVETVEVEG